MKIDPSPYVAEAVVHAALDGALRALGIALTLVGILAGALAGGYAVLLWLRLTLWVLDATGSPEAALALFISPAFIQAGVVGLLVYRHEIKKDQ